MAEWKFCLLILLLPVSAGAEMVDDGFDGLEEEFALLEEADVVFSAAKHEQEIADSPSTVTTITREQIENTHCLELLCVLRQVPGVEVRRVLPMYHSIGARAMAGELGDKVLAFIDGREINFEAYGMPFWGVLPLHLEDIERIEVVRGPGSALYGANAHSMVVSITTRAPDRDRAEAFAGAGERDRNSVHLRLDRVLGDWRLHLGGGLDTAGSWRVKDLRERELYWVSLRLERQWPSAVTSLDLGLSSADGAVHNPLAATWLRDIYLGHAVVRHQEEIWHAQAMFNFLQTEAFYDLPLFYRGIKLGEVSGWIPMFSSNLDAEAQVNLSPFAGNLLIVGANYRWLTYFSEDNDPSEVHQHRVGAFLHDEQRLFGQLILTAGLRCDYNSISPFTVSPRLALVWRYARNQSVRAAFGRAFRKPSFFNTSWHLTTVRGTEAFPRIPDFFRRAIGNRELGNESVTTFEAGYRGDFADGALVIESDVFFSLYRDTIAFKWELYYDEFGLPDLDRSQLRFENAGREVNSVGGSVSLTWRPHQSLRLSANYTYRHSWYISDPPAGMEVGESARGDRVAWEPAHLLNLSASWRSAAGLRAGAALYAASATADAWAHDGGLFSERIVVPNPARLVLGGFVAWRFNLGSRWLEAGVRAFNLLNAGFCDLSSVTRYDGAELGGELMSRRIFAFVRGGI